MKNNQQNIIDQTVKIFNNGGVIIFPTDTAFGLGCKIDNEKAIKRLIKIKQRPQNQAFPVLVSGIEMAKKYFINPLPNNIFLLMQKYWPGGLTIIYKANKENVLNLITGGGKNIGMRMPDNEFLLKVIDRLGVPIIGTSANYHNQPTPYLYSEIDKQIISQADYIIPGECIGKQASTVIDCTQEPWKILRQGSVEISSKFTVRSSK